MRFGAPPSDPAMPSLSACSALPAAASAPCTAALPRFVPKASFRMSAIPLVLTCFSHICTALDTRTGPRDVPLTATPTPSSYSDGASVARPHPPHLPGTWCTVGDGLRPRETPLRPGLRPGLLQSAGSFLGAAFFRLSGMGLADGGLCWLS